VQANVNLVCKREYYGTIKQVVMNAEWTAVLSEGKVTIHHIESQEDGDKKFPRGNNEKPIV